MKKMFPLFFFFLNVHAMSQTNIQGEYYFRKTEMASGFNFSAEGKFRFFFSYGAVDRNASGSFTVEGEMVKLKSDKEPGKDFSITGQRKQAKGYTLVFSHPNNHLLKSIRCIFTTGANRQEVFTNDNGEVHIDLPHCDTIYVQHMLYPDIATLVKDKANDNNHFVLSLNPSLEQVSFKGIDLTIVSDKVLTCLPNYFLSMPDIRFVKQ